MKFFEDIEPGSGQVSPIQNIDREEMLTFARMWDPLPFHVDEAAAITEFGSLTAPGLYVLAIKLRLIYRSDPLAVIASLGYDEIRFLAPLRPGDAVFLKQEWVSARLSKTKHDRGVVVARYTLVNQGSAVVMSHLDTLLVRRRFPTG